MTSKTLIVAVALLLSATSAVLAQSQRNYGPNGPATGNSFGEPYSGTAGARMGDRLAAHHLYAYYGHRPHRHWYR
jgi:hypothetical protein